MTAATAVLGVDLGHHSEREAEHWIAGLAPVPGLIACTHLVHGMTPGVVITLAASDVRDLPSAPGSPAADAMAGAHAAGRSGRAVVYPGVEQLRGVVTVAELLERSAIEHVHLLGTGKVTPGTQIDTRDFVRPQWMNGRLTLVATHAPLQRIAPFEVPNPTPCCGGAH